MPTSIYMQKSILVNNHSQIKTSWCFEQDIDIQFWNRIYIIIFTINGLSQPEENMDLYLQ